jgi:hypothetical protein
MGGIPGGSLQLVKSSVEGYWRVLELFFAIALILDQIHSGLASFSSFVKPSGIVANFSIQFKVRMS